jgi:glutamine synthetase
VDSESQDVTAVIEQLRSQDIDVVRVSYSDMIGIDRGRDVLLSELPAALGHGLPFSRCVYHTTPMGDCIPIQGGMEDGLPDIHVRPDLSTLAPLPWEPGAMACRGTPSSPTARRRRSPPEPSSVAWPSTSRG